MTKIKIAILTPTFYEYSGVDRVVQIQAEDLSKEGKDIKVIAFKGNIKPKSYSIKYIGAPNSPTIERLYRLFFFLRKNKIKQTASLLKDYDLIISHVYPMNLIASYAKSRYGIKYQFHNHGAATPNLFPKLSERIYLRLFNYFTNRSIRNIDSAVSISDYLRKILLKETGVDSKIVYDKIDKRRFNRKVKGDRIRRKYKLTKKDKVCLYVGRISPHKGVHLLIQAFDLAKKQNPNLKLLIVGKPTFDAYFKKLKQLSNENIIFCGVIPDKELPQYYSACDVYTTATLWEGFNLTVVEAQACGKPVIAFDIGPHPEVVRKGILVKPKDIKRFADAIAEVIESIKN